MYFGISTSFLDPTDQQHSKLINIMRTKSEVDHLGALQFRDEALMTDIRNDGHEMTDRDGRTHLPVNQTLVTPNHKAL